MSPCESLYSLMKLFTMASLVSISGLDVDGSALHEAGVVALLDVDVLRRAVGGKHDLLALVHQLVENLEHDVERARLALQKLDVVDQQHVGTFVQRLEVVVAGFVDVVGHAGFGVLADDFLGIGVHRH